MRVIIFARNQALLPSSPLSVGRHDEQTHPMKTNICPTVLLPSRKRERRTRGREKIAIEIQGCGHAEYCDISFLADIQFSGLKRRRRRAPTALIEMEHDMPIYLLPLSLFTATNATSRVCSPGIYTNKQQRSSSGRVGPRGRHRPGGGVYSRA